MRIARPEPWLRVDGLFFLEIFCQARERGRSRRRRHNTGCSASPAAGGEGQFASHDSASVMVGARGITVPPFCQIYGGLFLPTRCFDITRTLVYNVLLAILSVWSLRDTCRTYVASLDQRKRTNLGASSLRGAAADTPALMSTAR